MNTRFIFFGGKGGVGKTTCAAARAVSQAAGGTPTLIVSTDPAHSLGDVLARRLSARPRRVARGLDAVELDAPRAFARWLDERRNALGDALEHGTWLDRADVEALLDLPIPGVDELVGLLEIVRLAGGYRAVVIDTAPTGHTLRLVAAPHTVRAVAELLDALQEEHRIIRDQLARVGRPEAADRLIELLAKEAADTSAALRDSRRTSFDWVTLPEQLSIAESADGIAALAGEGIRVGAIVINRVLGPGPPCRTCDPRREEERRLIGAIRRSLARGRRLHVVPALLREPRGARALAAIGRHLASSPAGLSSAALAANDRSAAAVRRRSRGPESASSRAAISAESLDAVRGATLIFVGGKGGVGKTTIAAALAIRLAKSAPQRSVLLLSTDPAHSLADVLESPAGEEPSRISGAPANLRAHEVNAARAFENHVAELRAALGDLLQESGRGGLNRLLSLAPPGIDELFGMASIVDALAANQIVVVDTAPTGHALRMLATPEIGRAWVQVLMRLLLKYRSVVPPGRLGEALVRASHAIRDVQAALADRERTRFLVVTRAAAIARAETIRLLASLRSFSLKTQAVIVNARTLEPGRCRRCRSLAAAERAEVAALGRLRGCAIIQTPLAAPPPRGPAALNAWAQRWAPWSG